MDIQLSANSASIAVFGILLVFSLATWTIIFNKIKLLLSLKNDLKNHENLLECCTCEHVEKWHDKILQQQESFFSRLYRLLIEQQPYSYQTHSDVLQKRLYQELDLMTRDQEQSVYQSLSWLATIAQVSPYIGLLGTIWGVMQAFAGMQVEAAGMGQLAPGMSEALVATAAGLLVAIPASIAYNKFSSVFQSLIEKKQRLAEYFLVFIDDRARKQYHEIHSKS